MSNPIQLFTYLCSAINAFQDMKATERKRAANRDAGAHTIEAALSLVPEIIRRGETGTALVSAMKSGSTDLIMSFPAAPYDTYDDKFFVTEVFAMADTLDPDIVLALSSRGLSMNSALPVFLTRAFRQKDQRLRDWALQYPALQPIVSSIVEIMTPYNIQKRPDFAEALLIKSVEANPTSASFALETAVNINMGLATILLLHAGVTLRDDAPLSVRKKLDSLSNHQKLSMMRPSLQAFAADPNAVFVARNLFS